MFPHIRKFKSIHKKETIYKIHFLWSNDDRIFWWVHDILFKSKNFLPIAFVDKCFSWMKEPSHHGTDPHHGQQEHDATLILGETSVYIYLFDESKLAWSAWCDFPKALIWEEAQSITWLKVFNNITYVYLWETIWTKLDQMFKRCIFLGHFLE